jgi:hypothetical protein
MLRRTVALTAASFALLTLAAGAFERVWQQTGRISEARVQPAAARLAELYDAVRLAAALTPEQKI